MRRVSGNHFSVLAEFRSGKFFKAQFKDEQEARNEANRLWKMGAIEVTLDYTWYVNSHRKFRTIKTVKR